MRCFARLQASAVVFLLTAAMSQADWISLGSRNIEHLAHGDETIVPKALAEHIHPSGTDLLAMQEVYANDENNSTRTNTQLDEAFEFFNTVEGHSWTYEMLQNRFSGDKSQLVPIASNNLLITRPMK